MRRFIEELKDFPRKGDWILLILCLLTAFGTGHNTDEQYDHKNYRHNDTDLLMLFYPIHISLLVP